MSREQLYAARIAARAINITDVPKTRQKKTLELLDKRDKQRQQELLEKSTQNAAS